MSRLRHRQEVLHLRGGAEGDGPAACRSAVSASASTSAAAPSETSEQSVRFSGPATKGFFSLSCAAELEAEVLAHLRVGVVDAVAVVLGGDHRQRVGLVAVALEIGAARSCRRRRRSRPACRPPPAGRRPSAGCRPISGAGVRRHLLDADHQHDARRARLDRSSAPGAPPPSRWRRRSRRGSPA